MLLLFLELAMLGGGFYILVTGKIPKIITGESRIKKYEVTPGMARLIGLVMASPLPCVFLTNIAIGLTLPPELAELAVVFSEMAIVMGAAVLVTLIYVLARKPVEPDSQKPDDDPHIQVIWR